MKRIISILMLAVVIMMGANVEAKTVAKKSSKKSSSFNMKSFIDKPFLMTWKNTASNAKEVMKGLGFTYKGSYHTIFEGDYGVDERDVLVFTKNNISAEVYLGLKIILHFNSLSAANSFVSSSRRAFGGALRQYFDGSYIYLKNDYYWYMEQNGSSVTISGEENMDGGGSYYDSKPVR